MKFYICEHCGNIVTKLTDHNVPVSCCGEHMKELAVGTKEAATEKHRPVIIEKDGQRFVTVGSIEHPMTDDHYIEWVVVDYGEHYRVRHFKPGEAPMMKICNHCEPVDIYAYCNLHGLWNLEK